MPKAELALALTSGEEGQQAPPSTEGGEGNKAKGKGPKKREAADADLKEGVDGDEEKGTCTATYPVRTTDHPPPKQERVAQEERDRPSAYAASSCGATA